MSSIDSIGSSSSMMMQSMRSMKRPDPAEAAANLFSKLDTSGQGYIQKSDLQAAYDKISASSTTSASTSGTSDVDDLFSQLDTDSDGKVTKQEFSDSLKQLSEQLDSQLMSMRMKDGMQGGGAMGGMPPPPPSDETGFTKDELSSQLQEIGSSDSQGSELISSIIDNFDQADLDGDGKVSLEEAMAFGQSSLDSSSSASTSTSSSAASASTSASEANAKVMMQIMQLLQAYNVGSESQNSAAASLSVLA
jgi:Ca2+-binding EF-hand superfamily protein